jgi:peptide/nickel transport system substrate-binding protein
VQGQQRHGGRPHLTSPSSSFLGGLALSAFAIASPDALKKYNADEVGGNEEKPEFKSEFGTKSPIGTGPFKLESWVPGDKLTLVRNEDYWGEKAKLDKVIFTPIADGPGRRPHSRAARSTASTSSTRATARRSRRVPGAGAPGVQRRLHRLQLGQGADGQDRGRQAVAHAINRKALVEANYPPGPRWPSSSCRRWCSVTPTTCRSTSTTSTRPRAAGQGRHAQPDDRASGTPPTSRVLHAGPGEELHVMKADLEKAGFKVVPKSAPWNPDYLAKVDAGTPNLYLLGWTGDYGDPDNFVGTFFRTKQKAWGVDNPALRKALEDARSEGDQAKRGRCTRRSTGRS